MRTYYTGIQNKRISFNTIRSKITPDDAIIAFSLVCGFSFIIFGNIIIGLYFLFCFKTTRLFYLSILNRSSFWNRTKNVYIPKVMRYVIKWLAIIIKSLGRGLRKCIKGIWYGILIIGAIIVSPFIFLGKLFLILILIIFSEYLVQL